MANAARITAGYDDGPQLHEFAAAAGAVSQRARPVDREAVRLVVAEALSALCGSSAGVRIEDGSAGQLDWWRRGDGLVIGMCGGSQLAAALINRDCGGAFGVDDGAVGGTSVARRRGALIGALRAAIAAIWPDEDNHWAAGAPGEADQFALHLDVGGVGDCIGCAVAPPPVAAAAAPDHGDWQRRMAAALDALALPVRLVLHEGAVSVGAARSFAVGDVLPIATAHEVGLRIGALTVARGRMIGDAVEITRRAIQERS